MSTIGVAIAVPEPWGEQLRSYRSALGDPSAEGIPTHITLMPPFEIDDAQLPGIEQHLAEVAAHNSGFKLHLRGTGTFRPVSPVVFVVVVQGISNCEVLALSIRRGPLATQLQFPYHPHVTVAHDLEDHLLDKAFADLADFECQWQVDHFSLYVHEPTSGWRPTRDFALTAPADLPKERP